MFDDPKRVEEQAQVSSDQNSAAYTAATEFQDKQQKTNKTPRNQGSLINELFHWCIFSLFILFHLIFYRTS
jgi:hypothetical protein